MQIAGCSFGQVKKLMGFFPLALILFVPLQAKKSYNTSFLELGQAPVGRLLVKYATPAVVAMTASSLYNIIDAVFIGQGVGALAIAGISLTFPVMQLTGAFGAMVGVGAATLLSVKLGERDYDTARRILGNVLVMNVVMGVAIAALMLLFIDPILYFFGAGEETISYARDFMRVILYGNVVTHLYLGLNALLRSASHPKRAMVATIYTVLINVVLAPLFIYGFHWGIKGAAWATVLSQTIVLFWQFKMFSRKDELLHFQRGIYRLRRSIVGQSLAIGMSPFLMNLCACMITVVINWSLAHYGGDMEIASYGIVNRLAFLFLMVVIGLNQGMQPIAGYNYGARLYGRLHEVLTRTITMATCVMTFGFLLGMFVPQLCARAFTTDPELIMRVAHDMRIQLLAFPIIGFQIVTTNFFQCIGMPGKSIFLSLSRQLIFLLPPLLILPRLIGSDGIWWSMPISDTLATFTTAYLFFRQMKKFKRMEAAQ